ncbi:hypothetical protein D5272_10080 [bacterium D16-76]|nr:hypothetical protein [bacterium D16-76]
MTSLKNSAILSKYRRQEAAYPGSSPYFYFIPYPRHMYAHEGIRPSQKGGVPFSFARIGAQEVAYYENPKKMQGPFVGAGPCLGL